ncbi:MAG: hypothetical protein D6805_08930 [Planctomycetota bacterium]|nr:MAG: hypothetical protein D6805_08930 [Planctomycetota bacterium]
MSRPLLEELWRKAFVQVGVGVMALLQFCFIFFIWREVRSAKGMYLQKLQRSWQISGELSSQVSDLEAKVNSIDRLAENQSRLEYQFRRYRERLEELQRSLREVSRASEELRRSFSEWILDYRRNLERFSAELRAQRRILQTYQREVSSRLLEGAKGLRGVSSQLQDFRKARSEDLRKLQDGFSQLQSRLEAIEKRQLSERLLFQKVFQYLPRLHFFRRFQEWQEKYESGVVLIYSQVFLRYPNSTKKISIESFGTGFLVSRRGYVVTNKHILQPWKFGKLAEQIGILGGKVLQGEQRIALWPSGTKFLLAKGRLNFEVGYNNFLKKNLYFVGSLPDNMERKSVYITPISRVDYLAHRLDYNDLALLKIRGEVSRPLPIAVRRPRKLDPILILGYPRGWEIMDFGMCQTSPTLGNIRKVENFIYLAASIMPGTSGAPVISVDGEVVGICTQVYRKTETLGLAIPSRYIRKLLQRYVKK